MTKIPNWRDDFAALIRVNPAIRYAMALTLDGDWVVLKQPHVCKVPDFFVSGTSPQDAVAKALKLARINAGILEP